MSAAETEATDAEEVSPPVKLLRTVTPGYASHEDAGMNAVGWGVMLGLVILLVPLLPFIVIVWTISKVLERIG